MAHVDLEDFERGFPPPNAPKKPLKIGKVYAQNAVDPTNHPKWGCGGTKNSVLFIEPIGRSGHDARPRATCCVYCNEHDPRWCVCTDQGWCVPNFATDGGKAVVGVAIFGLVLVFLVMVAQRFQGKPPVL